MATEWQHLATFGNQKYANFFEKFKNNKIPIIKHTIRNNLWSDFAHHANLYEKYAKNMQKICKTINDNIICVSNNIFVIEPYHKNCFYKKY